MKSILKLKINHTVKTAKELPWDLVYLVKREDETLVPRLFKYYMVVEQTTAITEFLNTFSARVIEHFGMSRDSLGTDNVPYEESFIGKLVELEKYLLVIPLLGKGRKGVNKQLRYIATRKFRKDIAKCSASDYTRTNSVQLPPVRLSISASGANLPCLNCKLLHKKLIDGNVCKLGSSDCIKNIVLGSGSDFSDTLTGLSKEEVEDQLLNGGM